MSKRKSASERRSEIILTALRLAADLGPDRITAEAIAKELGVTQPAIFRHFPRKDDIWEAVIGWLGDALAERWAAAMAVPSELRLNAVLRAQFAFVEAFPALPLVLLSAELHARNDGVRRGVAALMGRFHHTLAAAIAADRDGGAVAAAVDPARAAWMLIAIVQGTAIRWVIGRCGFPLAEEGMSMVATAIQGIATG
ncbi:MAG: TetR/AcrR family transcriptional regulator [Magnetospirillum sp.]|nr:TetR/AcrR family transcriptional regulator [Magnetospirillum sp.]